MNADEDIVLLIENAINDAANDIVSFNTISENFSDASDKELIKGIEMDKIKQKKYLEDIYYFAVGKKFDSEIKYDNKEKLNNPGIIKIKLFEEMEEIDFLRKIYFSFVNLSIRDMIYEVITDLQNHAIKLTYLLSKR